MSQEMNHSCAKQCIFERNFRCRENKAKFANFVLFFLNDYFDIAFSALINNLKLMTRTRESCKKENEGSLSNSFTNMVWILSL